MSISQFMTNEHSTEHVIQHLQQQNRLPPTETGKQQRKLFWNSVTKH